MGLLYLLGVYWYILVYWYYWCLVSELTFFRIDDKVQVSRFYYSVVSCSSAPNVYCTAQSEIGIWGIRS